MSINHTLKTKGGELVVIVNFSARPICRGTLKGDLSVLLNAYPKTESPNSGRRDAVASCLPEFRFPVSHLMRTTKGQVHQKRMVLVLTDSLTRKLFQSNQHLHSLF